MNTPAEPLIDCPALHHRAGDYPIRFDGAVPKRIRMNEMVTPDPIVMWAVPKYRDLVARKGEIYPAWTNSHGAVCVVFPDGQMLGVKPLEFEVVEWHEINTCAKCHLPSRGAAICQYCARDAREEIAAFNSSLFLSGRSGKPTTSNRGEPR